MTEPRDELIDLLSNADPVDPSQLPTASSDQAQHVLENAMQSQDQPTIEDRTAAFTAVGSQGFNAPPQQEAKRTSRPAARRSYRILAAAAAAVIVLVAGVMVFSPSNTSPALAAVQNAADETASLDSGRATTTFRVEGGDDTESGFMTGVFSAEFSDRNAAFTVDLTDSSEQEFMAEVNSIETRLIGNVLYGNLDGEWFAIEADGLAATALSTFASYVDPRNVLATVQELVDAKEVGPATVDGLAVTHYQSVFDLGDETLAESGWLAGMENLDSLELDVEGEVMVDLYVDGDGFLRQLNVSGDLREPGGTGTADLTITTVFSDLNADITIEAPADVEIIDLSEELDGLDLEGLELDG